MKYRVMEMIDGNGNTRYYVQQSFFGLFWNSWATSESELSQCIKNIQYIEERNKTKKYVNKRYIYPKDIT